MHGQFRLLTEKTPVDVKDSFALAASSELDHCK